MLGIVGAVAAGSMFVFKGKFNAVLLSYQRPNKLYKFLMIKIIIFLGLFVNFLAYENFYSTIFFFSIFCISRLTINIFLNKNGAR